MISAWRKKRDGERNMKLWVLLLTYILMMVASGTGILSFYGTEFVALAWLAQAVARSR